MTERPACFSGSNRQRSGSSSTDTFAPPRSLVAFTADADWMSVCGSCSRKTIRTRAHDFSCSHDRYDPLFTMSDNKSVTTGSRRTRRFSWTKIDDPAGGARRDRTDDLLLAKQALSQLSYGPSRVNWWAWEDLNFRPHAYQARALTN